MMSTSAFSNKSTSELLSLSILYSKDYYSLQLLHQELVVRQKHRQNQGESEKKATSRLRETVFARLQTIGMQAHSGNGVGPMENTTVQNAISCVSLQSVACDRQVPSPSTAEVGRNRGLLRSLTPGFLPTNEQQNAIDIFKKGESLKINAFAGSGKTSTLSLLTRGDTRLGLYLAFSRLNVEDSKRKFGARIRCKTIHALAYESLLERFGSEKLTGKLNPNIVHKYASVEGYTNGGLVLSPFQVSSLILETFRRFCHGCEESIQNIRVPLTGALRTISKETEDDLSQLVREGFKKLWELMQDEKSPLPLGHDGYLKLWALSGPRLNYGYVMLDEAQDTNNVVIDVLQRQNCQIVYVGDRHQQIYEWRGAVNALDKLSTLHDCKLTKSFRFGQGIADVANLALHKLGETARIVGNENVRSEIGPVSVPSAILARSNGMVLSAVIQILESGMFPYVEGGTTDLSRLIQGYCDIRERGFSAAPELSGFTSWDQVVEYSQTEYGSELSAFVGLIRTHGPERLSKILGRVEKNAYDADITVSTIHKAKGREWDSVRIEDDFSIRKAEGSSQKFELSNEESRALYVALTRAKKSLQVGDAVKQYLGL